MNDYFTAARRAKEDQKVPVPEPRDQLVAITRRDWIVRRYELDPPRHALLESLASGSTVGEAIRRAAAATELDDEELARAIGEWFRRWCAEEFFVGVEGPGAEGTTGSPDGQLIIDPPPPSPDARR